MLDRADCADFGCHNSIRLETKHFLNTLALTFISFSGRFVFAMQKHYLFFCERSSTLPLFIAYLYRCAVPVLCSQDDIPASCNLRSQWWWQINSGEKTNGGV